MKNYLSSFVIDLLNFFGQVFQLMWFKAPKQRNSRQTLCFIAQV
jgi:hypothetical protein